MLQPFQMLIKFVNATVIQADAFKHSIPVKQSMVEDGDSFASSFSTYSPFKYIFILRNYPLHERFPVGECQAKILFTYGNEVVDNRRIGKR